MAIIDQTPPPKDYIVNPCLLGATYNAVAKNLGKHVGCVSKQCWCFSRKADKNNEHKMQCVLPTVGWQLPASVVLTWVGVTLQRRHVCYSGAPGSPMSGTVVACMCATIYLNSFCKRCATQHMLTYRASYVSHVLLQGSWSAEPLMTAAQQFHSAGSSCAQLSIWPP